MKTINFVYTYETLGEIKTDLGLSTRYARSWLFKSLVNALCVGIRITTKMSNQEGLASPLTWNRQRYEDDIGNIFYIFCRCRCCCWCCCCCNGPVVTFRLLLDNFIIFSKSKNIFLVIETSSFWWDTVCFGVIAVAVDNLF